MFGLGLGLAILIDVLIVRMVIAPAVVTLLGDRAWWGGGPLGWAPPSLSLGGSAPPSHRTPPPLPPPPPAP